MQLYVIILLLAAGTVSRAGNAPLHYHRARNAVGSSTVLLGDLAEHGATSATGSTIQSILSGEQHAGIDNDETYTAPAGGLHAQACRRNTCCVWNYIVQDMVAVFSIGDGSQCSGLARSAIRMGFHDSGAWNTSMPVPDGAVAAGVGCGGADGSVVLFPDELQRPENRGLHNIAQVVRGWYHTYHDSHGVSMADLIQMGALVATVTCPGGPRIRAFIGRHDVLPSSPVPPSGLLPPPTTDASSLLDMFAAKTFSPTDLVALTGAHTVSRQFFADPAHAGWPQDTTDGVFDTKFYTETAADPPPTGIYRFQSDQSLAADSVTGPIWSRYAGRCAQQK